MKKVIIFVFLFMFIASFSLAATYYVSDLFGDDANDGLSDTTPFATIQKAADVMVAGDKVIVDFGEYYESVVPKNSGAPGKPIIYEAKEDVTIMGDEDPIMPVFTLHSGNVYVMDNVFRTVQKFSEDGTPLTKKDSLSALDTEAGIFHDRVANKLYVRSSNDADPATHSDTLFFEPFAFDIVEGSYITIDGFKIKNGIHAVVAQNLVPLPGLMIQNNVLEGDADALTNDTAILIDGGAVNADNTYENFKIANNTFTDFWKAIYIKNAGRKSLVSQNTLVNIGIPPDDNAETIRLIGDDDYPDEAQCQGLLFERNYFEVYGRCFYFRAGRLDSVTIQNNIANAPGSLCMINYTVTNCHVINNTIIGCGDGYALRYNQGADNGRIYNNILAYNSARPLFFDNKQDTVNTARWDNNYWVTDTTIWSNGDMRLVRARNPNVSSGPGGPNAVYGHPMKAQKDTLVSVMTGDTLYVDEVPDMDQLALPLFTGTLDSTDWGTYKLGGVNDFNLAEGSLAIDAASPDWAPADDFFGNLRDSKPDIGAIEYGATSIETLKELFPNNYSLSQNYPNPFNPETTIRYQLPRSGKVRLTVYNVVGQIVAKLHDGFQRIGTYTVIWDGLDDRGNAVPSGLYICRLEAGSYSKTTKMMLLK